MIPGSNRIIYSIKNWARKVKQPIAFVINKENSNSYGVIVNLGRKGVPVLSVDSNTKNLNVFSRYSKTIICPDYKKNEDDYVEFLLDVGKALNPKPVLFVTGDTMVVALLRHRKNLERYFHMPMPSLETATKLVDKREFYRSLELLNIPHATTYQPRNLSDAVRISESLDYPYIIKPVESDTFVTKFGNKCLRAASRDELISLYKWVSVEEIDVIFQKEIVGTERYLVYMYFNRKSEPIAVCCYKKMRIYPIDYGNACACETVWDSEVVTLALSLLIKFGYCGLAEAEVQRDNSDGRLKLVEINARSTTEARLSARAGMNMEYIAYCDAIGQNMDQIQPAILGVKWMEILRDIQSVFSAEGYLANRKITVLKWLRSLRGKREYAFLAWDDPIPFIVLFWRFLRVYGFRMKNLLVFRRVCKKVFSKINWISNRHKFT